MEAAPSPAFEVPEPNLLLELLIIALDAPAQLSQIDEGGKIDVFRQGRQPVFDRLLLAFGPLDQQPLRRMRRGDFSSRCAGQTRRRANREDSGAAAPSRQVIVRHARFGKPNASALTENGRCSLSRRSRFAGRPRRERFFLAGNGALPGAHTVVVGTMPAAYVSPSAVMPARS